MFKLSSNYEQTKRVGRAGLKSELSGQVTVFAQPQQGLLLKKKLRRKRRRQLINLISFPIWQSFPLEYLKKYPDMSLK